MSFDNWLRLVPARREPQLRFVCFSHAGGSASFFRSWAGPLPDGVELAAACYPGREDRIADPLPVIRADYQLTARYDGDHSTAPVSAPLIAYYGLADEDLREHSVMAWSAFTRAEFSPRAMPGGHFYLNDDTAGLVQDILNQVGVARRQDSVILR